MYRIIRVSDGQELGMTDTPHYIKFGEDQCYTVATREDAIGVAFQSVPYNLIGHSDITDADTVIVSAVDSGTAVSEQQSMIDGLLISVLEG